jgi:hypothetical protein
MVEGELNFMQMFHLIQHGVCLFLLKILRAGDKHLEYTWILVGLGGALG